MAISIYDSYVPNFIQTLTGVAGFLDRGMAHCSENNIDPAEIVSTRLYKDMLPFQFQIASVVHHSIDAFEALKAGVFIPPGQMHPQSYADLQQDVAKARDAMKALKAADVDAFVGKDMLFQFGEMKIPFVAENFIASFSIPNFYFHATTAYDILRMKGVPLGKRDFTGPLRMKR